MVGIKFVLGDAAEAVLVCGKEGETLLDLHRRHQVELADIEFACEGSLACSSCHVIVDEIHYDMTGEISDDEKDMLDLADGLSKTSRLGCQVKLTKQLEGAVFTVPSKNRNSPPMHEA